MYKGKQTTTEAAASTPTPERHLMVVTDNTNTSKTQVETRQPSVKTNINTYRQRDDSSNNDDKNYVETTTMPKKPKKRREHKIRSKTIPKTIRKRFEIA